MAGATAVSRETTEGLASRHAVVRWHSRWRRYYELHRDRLRRTLPGELVVRTIDLKLPSRATVLSTQQVACLVPLAVGVMAMVHPVARGNIGRLFGILLGLDSPADDSLGSLFTSTQHIAAATGVIGLLFLLGWASGVPGYLQRLLEDIWSLPNRSLPASLPGQLAWFVGFGGASLALGLLPAVLFRYRLTRSSHAPLVALVVVSVLFLLVELLGNYALLGRRVPLRRLLPGTLAALVGLDVVLGGLHVFGSGVLDDTVRQFGLIAVTFLAQATAVVIAAAMTFGELLGAEVDRRRHPELWPDDVVVHDEQVSEDPRE